VTAPRDIRKSLETGLGSLLENRGYVRQPEKGVYLFPEFTDGTRRAELSVFTEISKGIVRVSAAVEIRAEEVERLLGDAPREARSPAQRVDRFGTTYRLAIEPSQKLDPSAREFWEAHDADHALGVVEDFGTFLDTVAAEWFSGHATVEQLRAAAAADPRTRSASRVRSVSAYLALHGRLDDAVADLEAYKTQLRRQDTTESVDAFISWLTETTAAHSTD
jgi:hypothetical protein